MTSALVIGIDLVEHDHRADAHGSAHKHRIPSGAHMGLYRQHAQYLVINHNRDYATDQGCALIFGPGFLGRTATSSDLSRLGNANDIRQLE